LLIPFNLRYTGTTGNGVSNRQELEMKITRAFVERQLERLNITAGTPLTPYTANPDGKGCTSNVGNYHLDNAYGGYSLQRICEGGGSTPAFTHGYFPLKEVSNQIHAYTEGFCAARAKYNPQTLSI
jgi:hypothetical protein